MDDMEFDQDIQNNNDNDNENAIPAALTNVPTEHSSNRTASKITKAEHTWIIENFEHMAQLEKIESPPFKVGGVSWQLKMYPNYEVKAEDNADEPDVGGPMFPGNSTTKFVSLYLYCNGPAFPSTCWNLKIPNKRAPPRSICGGRRAYLFAKSASRGFRKFCKTNRLLSRRSGFLDTDGSLTVQVVLDWAEPSAGAAPPAITHPDSSLAGDLGGFLADGAHQDVTLQGEGFEKRVHKCVLCARSPVFRAMFSQDMRESRDNRVEILDIEEEVMDGMLAYMYGDNAPSPAVARKLLLVADRYQIPGLVDLCQFVLANSLSVECACEVILMCNMLNPDVVPPPEPSQSFTRPISSTSSKRKRRVLTSPGPLGCESASDTDDPTHTSSQSSSCGPGRCFLLRNTVIRFIVDHFDEILHTPGFARLMTESPELAVYITQQSREVSPTKKRKLHA
eukprot:111103_1